jgi:hypothetical protein
MVFITAKTKCAICGEPRGQAKMCALPVFLRNAKDPLYPLSGRAFHADCYGGHPLREKAISVAADRKARMTAPIFVCAVCGEPIRADGCTTSLLTSELDHPLWRFNYMHFHQGHVADWGELAAFQKALENASRLGIWEGTPMVRLR